MIVVASSNGKVGMSAAIDVLRAGGTALDAIEAGIRLVEANPADHTVGFNGYPNILGQAELDACIMDGQTLESGGVAAVRRHMYPITIARKVMEELPHVLLVGDGADRFADECGLEPWDDMLTDEIRDVWAKKLAPDLSPEEIANIHTRTDLRRLVRLATDPERVISTVNFIAQDAAGNIASGVSTSGWGWKYPGRVGDSPIIGAGNYADNRYGAAGCTGMGEMAIRASTAHSVVFYMKMGHSVDEAATRAMQDLNDLGGRFISVMNLVAIDKDGNPAGYTSMQDRTFIYQRPEMGQLVEEKRQYIHIEERWDAN